MLSSETAFLVVSIAWGWRESVNPVIVRAIAPVPAQKLDLVSEGTPDTALEVIHIARGSVAAQLGVSARDYVLRLAERVGPSGKVYACDTQRARLDRLKSDLSAH